MNSKLRNRKESKPSLFPPLCFLFLTLFFFTPLQLYLKNSYDIQIPLRGVILNLCFMTIGLLFIFFFFAKFFKAAHAPSIVAFVTALAFLLWLQGNILAWQYGPLDGSLIQWHRWWTHGAIDSFLWVGILSFVFYKTRFLSRRSKAVSLFFIALQTVVFLITAARTIIDDKTYSCFELDRSQIGEFSKDKNILIIILDEFQSDIFGEIIQSDHELRDAFQDFIYFRNALAGGVLTNTAVSFIFTNKLYDNSEQIGLITKKTLEADSIFSILARNNFRSEYYYSSAFIFQESFIPPSPKIFSNAVRRHIPFLIFYDPQKTSNLIQLSFFSNVPHYLKFLVYDGEWLSTRLKKVLKFLSCSFSSNTFLRAHLETQDFKNALTADEALLYEMAGKLRAIRAEGIMKAVELEGMHSPLVDYESSFRKKVEYNRANYTKQAKAVLLLVSQLIQKIKEAGLYDNSLIFIVSDHGSGRSSDMSVRCLDLEEQLTQSGMLSNNSETSPRLNIKARSYPLLLAKQIRAKGPLRVSDAPVSTGDIPKTILSELNINVPFDGANIFTLKETEERWRHCAGYGWRNHSKQQDGYIEDLTLYDVQGHVCFDSSWKEKKILPPRAAKSGKRR